MSKTKFSTVRTRILSAEEAAELNAVRLKERGYVSSMAQEVICGDCGAVTFIAPRQKKSIREQIAKVPEMEETAAVANPLIPEEVAAKEAADLE